MISIANKLRFAAESLKLHELLRFKSKMSPKQIEDLQKKVLESKDYAKHGLTLMGHGIELIPEFKEKAFKSFKENEFKSFKKNSDGSYDCEGNVYLSGPTVHIAGIIKDGRFAIKFSNVKGSFSCSKNNLTSLEGAPKSVEGYFSCANNHLTSLKGAPESVRGDFNCNNNKLTNLKGAPESVMGDFSCDENNLTSLEGAPESVGGSFSCKNNPKLTSLERAPKSVGRDFWCKNNPKLTSLEGIGEVRGEIFSDIKDKKASEDSLKLHEILRFKSKMSPKQIEDLQKKVLESPNCIRHGLTLMGHGIELIPEFKEKACKKLGLKKTSDGSYGCDGDVDLDLSNRIPSGLLACRYIAGIIKNGKFGIKFNHVGGDFICSENHLTSLEGAPESVGEHFSCVNNNLTSLEGAPKSVGKNFVCNRNNLTNLEGAPESVGWSFYCLINNLTSLKGAPKSVGGDFDCRYNPKLTSLEGIGKVKRKIISDIKDEK